MSNEPMYGGPEPYQPYQGQASGQQPNASYPQYPSYAPYPPQQSQPAEQTQTPYPGAYGSEQQQYGQYPQYPQGQAYGAAPAYPGYYAGPMPQSTNGMAIASLACSIASYFILPLIGAILGVIFGHMALGQIKTSNEQGRGMAVAGLVLGYIQLGLTVLIVGIIILVIIISAANAGTSTP